MIKRTVGAIVIAFVLAGCAGSPLSPVRIGADTYMLAKHGGVGDFSGGVVKAELFQYANEFCRKQNLYLAPVGSSSNDVSAYAYATAEIQFRCLPEGDPELKKPYSADYTIRVK